MKNSNFHADTDNLEIALHTATLFTMDEAWCEAYRLTEEQAHIDNNRYSKWMAVIDAQEMKNYHSMSADEAWDAYKAEEDRKSN